MKKDGLPLEATLTFPHHRRGVGFCSWGRAAPAAGHPPCKGIPICCRGILGAALNLALDKSIERRRVIVRGFFRLNPFPKFALKHINIQFWEVAFDARVLFFG